MIVCFPAATNSGIEGRVYHHFGSAPFFVFYDSETDKVETTQNKNLHHSHGTCQPASVIKGKNIDAVICGGMGSRAISLINAENIKVYLAKGQSIKESIEDFLENRLSELTPKNACKRHECGH